MSLRRWSAWQLAAFLLLVVMALPSVSIAETIIQAPGPAGPLEGTFVSPAAAGAPVVLIVPGSGPTNRDGNGPQGLSASIYRLLAEGLVQRGIASVRVDKRGMFGSSGAMADPNAVTIDDYASDVHAWVRVIRERTGNTCVWVIGHSEGGLVSLAAAQRPAGLCGLVLLAAPGRRLSDVLRQQLRDNPANAPVLDQALAAIDRLETGESVDVSGLHPALLPLFRAPVQTFLIDLFKRDPAKLIATVQIPALIVQGKRDLQVSVADAERLAKANPSARLLLLDAANHVLKDVPANDRAANLGSYTNPDLPLATGLADAVADFILASPPSRRR